nr:MAG TPA: Nematode cuticle collagen N-terminal domain [Caudoviricetes sp.]
MEKIIEKIDWSLVRLCIFGVIAIVLLVLLIAFFQTETEKDNADMKKRIRICKTYSNDFWRNDIDFIDGKCYYKGKEVEIK